MITILLKTAMCSVQLGVLGNVSFPNDCVLCVYERIVILMISSEHNLSWAELFIKSFINTCDKNADVPKGLPLGLYII